jgi:hypothetical protein
VDVLDDVLSQLKQWQGVFPDHQQSFELAREYVSKSLDGYRAMLKRSPIEFLGALHRFAPLKRSGRALVDPPGSR